MKLSNAIDNLIMESLNKDYNTSYMKQSSPFEELISMGELVDRLSVVNLKLYKLKDDQVNSNDKEFLAYAAKRDVELVIERARLKKCIDEKIITILKRYERGDKTGGFNAETKRYG